MSALISAMTSVALLVAMSAPGYVMQKMKKLPDRFSGGLTELLLYVCLPCMTVSSFAQKDFEARLLLNMAAFLVLSAVLLLLGCVLATRILGHAKPGLTRTSAQRVRVAAGYINNCGFMGVPIIKVLFPGLPEPLMYAGVFSVAFNILTWTLLVYTLTGEKKHMRLSRAFLNPPTIVLLIALPVFFFNARHFIPAQVLDAVAAVGEITTPLSMIVLGVRLADVRLRDVLTSASAYLAAAVKLVVVPALALGVMLAVGMALPSLRGTLSATMVVIMGMPAAFSVVMFSEMYTDASGEAAKNVLLSSLLSMITIPFLSIAANALTG